MYHIQHLYSHFVYLSKYPEHIYAAFLLSLSLMGQFSRKKKLPASLNIQYVRFGSLPAVNSETNRFLTVIKPRESSQGIKPRPPVSVPECNSHLPKQTTTKRKTM